MARGQEKNKTCTPGLTAQGAAAAAAVAVARVPQSVDMVRLRGTAVAATEADRGSAETITHHITSQPMQPIR